jgi:hypothetical protein
LQNKVGEYTQTLSTASGKYGSSISKSDAVAVTRITFIFPAETATTEYTEIGIFGYDGTVYTMFSRIKLPVPIPVAAGQQMEFTYEIVFSFPYSQITQINDFDMGWGSEPTDARISTPFEGADSTVRCGLIDLFFYNTNKSVLPLTSLNGGGNDGFNCGGLFSPGIWSGNYYTSGNYASSRTNMSGARAARGNFTSSATQEVLTWTHGNTSGISESLLKEPYAPGQNYIVKRLLWRTEISHQTNIGYFNIMGMGIMLRELREKTLDRQITMFVKISFDFN